MSPFSSLQRRLREAVQLLEDYKHGTLRPGVTNEQVTQLEVGKKGSHKFLIFSLRPDHSFFLRYLLLLRLHTPVGLWLFGGHTQVSPVP